MKRRNFIKSIFGIAAAISLPIKADEIVSGLKSKTVSDEEVEFLRNGSIEQEKNIFNDFSINEQGTIKWSGGTYSKNNYTIEEFYNYMQGLLYRVNPDDQHRLSIVDEAPLIAITPHKIRLTKNYSIDEFTESKLTHGAISGFNKESYTWIVS